MQDDLLNGHLTCEETLLYTARLRCPEDTSEAQRRLRVNKVLAEMGLEHARHTVVGTPMKKGISGGERKRLCVGIELLGEPKLLFLVLLKAGDIAYQGPARDALAYFEQTGFPCPPLTNPADHILDSCVSLSRTESSHSLVFMIGQQHHLFYCILFSMQQYASCRRAHLMTS
eukprot:3011-Heterococcus_DN1.PRE.3